MQSREMSLADEFKELSRQHFAQAVAATAEGKNDDEVWQLFYASIFDLTCHLTPDLLNSEDYNRMMDAWANIISLISTSSKLNDRAKEMPGELLRFYKKMDHEKAGIMFYLAAYDAMTRYAQSKSEITYGNVSDWIEFAEIAEDIHGKIVDLIFSPNEPHLTVADWHHLAACNLMLGMAYLNVGNLDKGMKYCLSAIHICGIHAADIIDIMEIGIVYEILAKKFEFENVHSQIFGFASDLFQGSFSVSFQDFEKMIFAASRQHDPDGKLNDILLQIIRLIDGRRELLMAKESSFSNNSYFVNQMAESYFIKRFEDIHSELSAVEEKRIQEALAPLKDTQSDLDEVLGRADEALACAEKVFATVPAWKRPSSEQSRSSSPNLFSRISTPEVTPVSSPEMSARPY